METVRYLSGGAAYRATYQVASTVIANIPLLVGAANGAGLATSTTTSATQMVGVNYDAATYVTAQQTDGTTAERTVTVDIRPDAIIKARISGSTATGGALTTAVVTTATTDGLTVIASATDFTTPSMDEGTIFGYTGVNARQLRKITGEADGTATVDVAFENDHQVGDEFIVLPFFHMDVGSDTVTLTTELDEVRANVAISASAADLQCIEILQKDVGGEGTTKTFALFVAGDHVLSRIA